jgi:hypothetical protein
LEKKIPVRKVYNPIIFFLFGGDIMPGEEGIKIAVEHLLDAANKQLENGNATAAAAILASAQDLCEKNGFTQEANQVASIIEFVDQGDLDGARGLIGTTIGGWDQGGWDQ